MGAKKIAILLLAFALAATAQTCTTTTPFSPNPDRTTPAPTPAPTSDPSVRPSCPPGQIPYGVFDSWLGCRDDPNVPDQQTNPADPSPGDEDATEDEDEKQGPGSYVVETKTTEDGEKVVFERPPLCSTVPANTPCITGHYEDEDGNEVWLLPEDEGGNPFDKVNTVFCGNYGDSLDHTDAPTPHTHPAPFPYDHDGDPKTPDICSHSSENCAWHNTCPPPRPTPNPVVPAPTPAPRPTPNPVVPAPTPAPRPTPPSAIDDPKKCVAHWNKAERDRKMGFLRWESVVPYDKGFTGHHHPEVPGGEVFLATASTPDGPARHWIALKPASELNLTDAGEDACQWTATAVGVSLRELLPYYRSDLDRLRLPGASAAAAAAREAAALWNRLGAERRQWYRAAFPRRDPVIAWCGPGKLPPWTEPPEAVLSLTPAWESRYGGCRWSIPRRGFWEWRLLVRYVSEEGDRHVEVAASDLSWFREPTGYLGGQVTLW
ncbi:MAG: hypothetical protein OXF64_05675 [bacterium]|nr:hypothetical protein [bacterium]